MGRDLADASADARAVFETVDGALGESLTALMFEGPAEELTLTHNAQPALLAHGAALWSMLRDRVAPHVRAAAGHSLGEFTAYYAASALPLADATRLVRRRGTLMYESGVRQPGAMAALLGDMSVPVEALCEQASREAGLAVPANYNCPGQLVISGEVTGVERAMQLAREAGVKRAMRLNVSGAFHSPLMESAAEGLAQALAEQRFETPQFPVYSNVTAEPVRDPARASALLLEQLTSPVRWTDELLAIAGAWPDALYVELGPGSVLTGLAKKIAPALRVQSCSTAADVDQLLELVA